MDIDLIEVDEGTITVIDTDGNTYTIQIESENETESDMASAILQIGYTIMQTVPADDEDGEQPLPYYSDEDDY